jgi:hypothetical protein
MAFAVFALGEVFLAAVVFTVDLTALLFEAVFLTAGFGAVVFLALEEGFTVFAFVVFTFFRVVVFCFVFFFFVVAILTSFDVAQHPRGRRRSAECSLQDFRVRSCSQTCKANG